MSALERHYTVKEIANLWRYSTNTIRRLFRDEKGTVKIGSPETRFKRKRWQLSIPESVVLRVHDKLRNG
jgi:hypothetical protein